MPNFCGRDIFIDFTVIVATIALRRFDTARVNVFRINVLAGCVTSRNLTHACLYVESTTRGPN